MAPKINAPTGLKTNPAANFDVPCLLDEFFDQQRTVVESFFGFAPRRFDRFVNLAF